jgi:hypothetical protein
MTMDDQQLLRYSRHILLDEIDIEGQTRLLQGHALVIGAGGLGSPAAMYLASAGVGHITLVDHDTVDLTNLQRQIMHTTARVGQPKVESGREALQQINPGVQVTALAERVEGERLQALVAAPTWCWTAATTSPPAMRSTAPAWRPGCRWCRARRSASMARSASSTRQEAAPAMPACSRPSASSRKCSAPPWACSRRWSASSAPCRRRGHQAAGRIGRSLAGRLLILDAREMEWTSIAVGRDHQCPVCASGTGPEPPIGPLAASIAPFLLV